MCPIMIARNALIRGIRITKHLIRATTKDITRLENELEIAQGTKNRLTIFDRIEIHDRTQKETAKAIFEELKANEEPNPEYCDCWLVAVEGKKFIEIAKKYGVEVT